MTQNEFRDPIDSPLYFNHAGTSWPKPPCVVEAVRESMDVCPSHWPGRFDVAHQAIADYFRIDTKEQLLLTPGCTSALAVAVADTLVANGKRLVTSSWEHHAMLRPLLKRAESGTPLVQIPPDQAGDNTESARSLDLDWLEDQLRKHDVGLVALTAACNVTGELLPYEAVIEMAHRFDTTVLLDAAQIVGWKRLDLTGLGADMVAFGGHKGLQGPWGIGGLYLSDRMRMACVDATCALPDPELQRPPNPRPGYCDVGSVDQFALAGLNAAIAMREDQEPDLPLSRARNQIGRIRDCLATVEGIRFYGPNVVDDCMPTIAFTVHGHSSADTTQSLARHGVIAGSGTQCAPLAHETLGTKDTGVVRLSVGMGQSEQSVDDLIDRLPVAVENTPPRVN
ncbi:MAG: aminotransferase class V-fold PLP-dependent enzyme [Planctomycetota bacterium]